MKDPKHYLHPVFQLPISQNDLHKIYTDIEKAQIDAYNQGIDDAAKKTDESILDYLTSKIIKDSILKLKKSVTSTN